MENALTYTLFHWILQRGAVFNGGLVVERAYLNAKLYNKKILQISRKKTNTNSIHCYDVILYIITLIET